MSLRVMVRLPSRSKTAPTLSAALFLVVMGGCTASFERKTEDNNGTDDAVQTDTREETDSGRGTGSDTTVDSDTPHDSGSGTGFDTDTPSDSGSETAVETDTPSDSGSGTGFDSDTPSNSDSDSDTVEESCVLTETTPGASSKYDTWNNPDNWEGGIIPSGTRAAVVAATIAASVDNDATPAYSGGLLLENGARLTIGAYSVYSANANALGTGPITMREGSEIIARAGLKDYDFFQGIVLEGDATIWAGQSTANHWTEDTFSGGIRGAGQLTYNGVQGTWFIFNTGSPFWTGGFQTGDPQNELHAVEAGADGCFGTGHVSINNNCTLVIAAGLFDTIHDAAALTLNGAPSSAQASKLVLNSGETVGALFIDDVQRPAGQYTNSESWLSGDGTLTVLTGP